MRPSFALLCALLLSAAGIGCSVVNTDHCGNRDGNATCLQRDPATPYCSICVADNDGCLAADPGAACLAETAAPTSVDPSTGGQSSTGPEPTTGTTAPGTASSSDATLTGDTTSAGSTSSTTTTSTGDESSSTTGSDSSSSDSSSSGGPMCGNNKIEGEEVCDGTDLDGKQCATLLPDKWGGGTLACNECASYNDTNCCIGLGQECKLVMPDGACCKGLTCKAAEPLVNRCQN